MRDWGDERTCMKYVKDDGCFLEFVVNQTPEICMEACRETGWALQYVKTQTPELCLEAVKQNGWALVYVLDQTPEICIEAVNRRLNSMQFIRIPFTEEMEDEIVILSL